MIEMPARLKSFRRGFGGNKKCPAETSRAFFQKIVILEMRRFVFIFFLFLSVAGNTQTNRSGPDSFCTWGDFDKMVTAFGKLAVDFLVIPDDNKIWPCNFLENFLHIEEDEWDHEEPASFDSAMHKKMNDIWTKEFKREYDPKNYIRRKELAVFIDKYVSRSFKKTLKRFYNWPHELMNEYR
jgi:hypothetical protein